MCNQLSLESESICYANQALQSIARGIIHKAPYVPNKHFGHIHTNTTNIYSTVGNTAVVYNECKHKPLSILYIKSVFFRTFETMNVMRHNWCLYTQLELTP